MKKFGLGKKGDADDDSSRRALFGSRSKNKSPAPPTNNPYAQSTAPPDPYTQAKISAGILPSARQNGGPRPPPGGGTGLPSGPSLKKGSGDMYGQNESRGGYGNDKYGNAGGYGQDKFGSDPYGNTAPAGGNSRYGAGGYGGLGRTNSQETTSTDANREELFGGARDRLQQQGPTGYGAPSPYSTDSAQGAGQSRNYQAYGDRTLTAEEEEEEDIAATKEKTKDLKQQTVASSTNALRVALAAEETGRRTLARLGDQAESLYETEKRLDLSANHQTAATEKANNLRVANRGMFHFHMNAENPFTKRSRDQLDQKVLARHRDEREQREATRQAAFESDQRMNEKFRALGGPGSGGPQTKSSLAERAKYQFEADSDDDRMEDEIDNNLDQISQVTGRLNLLAKAQGEEVDQQNQLLERLGKKVRTNVQRAQKLVLTYLLQSDRVDDQLAMNRKRLERIR
jgi:protein transport protein SEC9